MLYVIVPFVLTIFSKFTHPLRTNHALRANNPKPIIFCAEIGFSGNPNAPHFSNKIEVTTWPNKNNAIQLVAPSFGAKTKDEVTTIAPKNPPIQIHQGCSLIVSTKNEVDFISPKAIVMIPNAMVPRKKEIVEASQGLSIFFPNMELIPGCMDIASPDRRAKIMGKNRFIR